MAHLSPPRRSCARSFGRAGIPRSSVWNRSGRLSEKIHKLRKGACRSWSFSSVTSRTISWKSAPLPPFVHEAHSLFGSRLNQRWKWAPWRSIPQAVYRCVPVRPFWPRVNAAGENIGALGPLLAGGLGYNAPAITYLRLLLERQRRISPLPGRSWWMRPRVRCPPLPLIAEMVSQAGFTVMGDVQQEV